MDRIVELGRLLDFYGMLLTERQRSIIRQTVYEDCSLSEIAERESMSRQGVRDAILHGERQLRLLESTLHLVERVTLMEKRSDELRGMIACLPLESVNKTKLLDKIAELSAIWEDEDGI